MAQYDFKAPIKVTMIFEENEENELTELTSIKLEENDNSSILGSVDNNEIKHKTNIELTQIPTVTVQENSKRIASKVDNDSSKEIRVKNAGESRIEHIDNSLKRKTDNEYDLDKNSKKLKNNNKENPSNLNSIPNTGEGKLINNEDKSNVDGNNNNKHLNDLDNTTLIEINAKILIELLKTVSEHLLIIINKHFSFLQIQNDKSINLYTLDNFKHCYLRLKYHYFDLSYCTVSTILLPQEKNTGFIGRFLNHTLQLGKEKGINCTYNILETLFFEMIHWAKVKKKHVTSFTSNVSSHNENIMLKQQLLIPPKKIQLPNSGDLHTGKQVQSTCIFSSGPVGRQVKISVAPTLIQQNNQQLNHGTSVPQKIRQSRNEPSSNNQNKPNISDKSLMVNQIGQPLSVEPSSNHENSQPSVVEPSLTNRETLEVNPESSLIHQNRWNVGSESSFQQLDKLQSTTELSSCLQNSHLNYVESPLSHQNTQQINSDPSLMWQNKQQNNFKQTDPSIQQNIQQVSPAQSSIHQLNKQQLYNEPWSFQQNNQLINVEPSITHINSEKISAVSLTHQNRKRKINKTTTSWHNRQHVKAEPLPTHQIIPQTAAEQSSIIQNREPHPSLQNPGTFMQAFRNNTKNIMEPTQCVNYMNSNFSHYNPLSYANYSTNERYSQPHPYNKYHPPNVFLNYGTAPRAGPPPPNYEDAIFRQHYNDTINQLRNLSRESYNQEPGTQNPEVLLPNIDTTRSSVSKDSGIMSPLYSETSTDQLSVPLIEDLPPSANVTPLITHVTSLNPNASYIIEGQCTVCQKLTNSKCLGCYKCYYCGHECQTKDWNSHKYICRTASDAYPN